MLSYNACGLASSILELEQCALEYSVDIILVQETFLKQKSEMFLPTAERSCSEATSKPSSPWGCRHPLWRSKFKSTMEMQLHKRKRTKMIDLAKDLHFDVIAPTQTYFPNNGLPTENSPKTKQSQAGEGVALAWETDTPILNNIPDNIETTDEIDYAIGALTNHIATVIEDSSRRSRRPTVAETTEDVRVLLKAKTQPCVARAISDMRK
ncbi:hypothetical protein EVAR_46745_1 [Eumeta japonica]|uniref:Endonuclease/exonuclease/phosphatase domain-containing protein n=1 Tax=Eumeta variegata TaxID=151549 RepID=A0A4C2A8N5_EUMVA|nr:hypothetical protein EVAR_46745_1 [Eumeta japonica]